MALDFQQVRQQILALGEAAPGRQRVLKELRQQARQLLQAYAGEQESVRRKVRLVAEQYDSGLRCARPADADVRGEEALDGHFTAPPLSSLATIIAADGSQIPPDRHAPVAFCLINVGAIQMRKGVAQPPSESVTSQLFYDEALYTPTGTITDARLALMRDLEERSILAVLAEQALPPVITFTDGPMELWASLDSNASSYFQEKLEKYTNVLGQLCGLGATTAGYVDKPAANLVVRMLEMLVLHERELPNVKMQFPLRGVHDTDLFLPLLGPGERSAVFALQASSAAHYTDYLALHFFYMNVGRPGKPWIARVDIPGWVASNDEMLNQLQAALLEQCRIMGTRPYPYLLHRAHEVAVVSFEERQQVIEMIALELRRRGVEVGEQSNKQAAKDLERRTSYR